MRAGNDRIAAGIALVVLLWIPTLWTCAILLEWPPGLGWPALICAGLIALVAAWHARG